MLDEGAPVPVYVLSGNHDPLLPGGVWDRPPWNRAECRRVRLLREPRPVEVGPGVVLFPCPVFRKTSTNDPTTWIAGHPPNGEAVRIGVAHGSLRVRDDLPADDHLIARTAAQHLQSHYLALGHWHVRKLFPDAQGITRTAYPGVPEPMRFQGSSEIRTGWVAYGRDGNRAEFLDDGTGEVLHVRIAGPCAAPEITPFEVGNLIWQEECRELVSEDDLSRLIGEVATRPAPERRLLRLKLAGVLDAAAMLRLEELRQILVGRYLLGELDETDLHVQPTGEQVQEVAGQDLVCRSPHLLGHCVFSVRIPSGPLPQTDTADARGRPQNHFRIAVFTDHVGVDRVRIDVDHPADDLFQARGIEHGPGSDDACRRQTGHLGQSFREHIHWITHNDNHSASARESRADIGDQGGVLAQ